MESSLLNGWGIDPAYIIIALAVLTLVLLVAVLVCIASSIIYTLYVQTLGV